MGWFNLVKELQDEWTAALSTALLALLPAFLLFEKTVMLEAPCLALCIAASACWTKNLALREELDFIWSVGFASAALLTKQNSIDTASFCLASALALGGCRLPVKPAVSWSVAAVVLIAGPYYFLVYWVHWQSTVMNLTYSHVSGAAKIVFYWRCLPGQLGWTLLLLSLLGLSDQSAMGIARLKHGSDADLDWILLRDLYLDWPQGRTPHCLLASAIHTILRRGR